MEQKKKRKSHIPVRLNIFFSVIVLLFGALVFRLIDLQVVNSQTFHQILENRHVVRVKQDMTRGQIYDRNGVLLVGNQAYTAVQYTRQSSDPKDLILSATELAKVVSVSTENMTDRQYKDFWSVQNQETLLSRLSSDEKKLTGSALYQAQLDKITEDDIAYSDTEKQIATIFTAMNRLSVFETGIIKSRGVTPQEIAGVTEYHLGEYGFSIGSDWERTYPEGDTLKAILGTVSTSAAGIPETDANAYLARGLASNARVGTSYLEKQYDDVLRGTPKTDEFQLDSNNRVVEKRTVYQGQAGSNVVLSIDSRLQKKVDAILTNFLSQSFDEKGMNYSVYAVVQQANTGELLAISGKKMGYDESENVHTQTVEDDSLGVINSNFVMGSVVKAAMVATGYEYGAISEQDNILLDTPLHFGDSINSIRSYFNPAGEINVNDITALERSSNIYMVRLAMAIGGQKEFNNGDYLSLNSDVVDKIRKSYANYGLGGSTGIDLPVASRGYSPYTKQVASSLYLSFGQYDTYSPLQVSQYMATVANGGTRYASRLARDIRSINGVDTTGKLELNTTNTIMNRVNITDSQMNRIHSGLYQVTHGLGGTESRTFAGYFPSVSGKTGTAETLYAGPIKTQESAYVLNSIFSGYAPSDNPEIVVTVIIPYVDGLNNYAGQLSRSIFNAYFYGL